VAYQFSLSLPWEEQPQSVTTRDRCRPMRLLLQPARPIQPGAATPEVWILRNTPVSSRSIRPMLP